MHVVQGYSLQLRTWKHNGNIVYCLIQTHLELLDNGIYQNLNLSYISSNTQEPTCGFFVHYIHVKSVFCRDISVEYQYGRI